MTETRPTMSNLETSIRDLVISHEGFWEAMKVPVPRRTPDDWRAVEEWATMLKNSQLYLGIFINDLKLLDQHIAEAVEAKAVALKTPF